MCHRKIRPGTFRISLLALLVGLGTAQLQLSLAAQTPDPGTPPAANPMPTQPYVLPPTSARPATPATAPTESPQAAPHAIVLPPPPDAATDTPKPAKAAANSASKKSVASPSPTPAPSASPTVGQAAPVAQSTPTPQTPTVPATASNQGAATFGFYPGETRDQIIAAVGKDNVLKQQGDLLEVAAAPKPDPTFDSFLLVVGKQAGLVKLIATGKDIEDDASGRLMKAQFTGIKTDLSKTYGEPSDNFDFLDSKATHRSPGQFMLSLTNSERTLAAYWTKKDFGNQIGSISLSGNGLGDDTGYLTVEYEFTGYHAYLLAKE